MKKYLAPLCYILLAVFSAYMLFYRLDGRVLWADEAETALLAQNINRYGVPKVSDDKNTVTVLGPSVDSNASGLWIWAPWLDKYITAGSLRVFGKSTLSARLPFALMGFAALWLAVFVAWKMYRSHRHALMTGYILACSQLFVLHARQCRYYSILMLGQAWLLYGLWTLAEGRTKRGAFHVALALAFQFYGNYAAAAGNVIALVLVCVFFGRKITGLWKGAALSAGIFSALVLPWVLYAKIWRQGGVMAAGTFSERLSTYLLHVNFWLFPFILLLLAPLCAFIHAELEDRHRDALKKLSKKERKNLPEEPKVQPENLPASTRLVERFLWLCAPVTVLVLAKVSLPPMQRYLCVLPVPLAIAAAVFILRYVRGNALAVGVAALCFATNLPALALWPWRGDIKPQSPAWLTAREIFVPYHDRLDDALAYFKQNLRPGQTVFGYDPEFALIFYTDIKMVDGRFVPGQQIPQPLPDWILADTASGVTPYTLTLPPAYDSVYERVSVPVRDTKRASAIPEPEMHERFTPERMTVLPVYKKRVP